MYTCDHSYETVGIYHAGYSGDTAPMDENQMVAIEILRCRLCGEEITRLQDVPKVFGK